MGLVPACNREPEPGSRPVHNKHASCGKTVASAIRVEEGSRDRGSKQGPVNSRRRAAGSTPEPEHNTSVQEGSRDQGSRLLVLGKTIRRQQIPVLRRRQRL